jgi:hypothetical protein
VRTHTKRVLSDNLSSSSKEYTKAIAKAEDVMRKVKDTDAYIDSSDRKELERAIESIDREVEMREVK